MYGLQICSAIQRMQQAKWYCCMWLFLLALLLKKKCSFLNELTAMAQMPTTPSVDSIRISNQRKLRLTFVLKHIHARTVHTMNE